MQQAKLIDMPAFEDVRGQFVKTFNDSFFRSLGIDFSLKESYFSISKKGVIRGLHFQLPPHHHAKIVFCPVGKILDVAVDLRKASPQYGQCFAQHLTAQNHKAFYIPEGFAHGFQALTEDALTYYLVSSEYEQSSDTGILYHSIDFDWGGQPPILSERDKGFVALQDFISPF